MLAMTAFMVSYSVAVAYTSDSIPFFALTVNIVLENLLFRKSFIVSLLPF